MHGFGLQDRAPQITQSEGLVDFSVQGSPGLQHFMALFIIPSVTLFRDCGRPWDAVFCRIYDVGNKWGEGVLIMKDNICDFVHTQLYKLLQVSPWKHPVARVTQWLGVPPSVTWTATAWRWVSNWIGLWYRPFLTYMDTPPQGSCSGILLSTLL